MEPIPLIPSICDVNNQIIVTNCVNTSSVIPSLLNYNDTITKIYYNCTSSSGINMPICLESTGIPPLSVPQARINPVTWTPFNPVTVQNTSSSSLTLTSQNFTPLYDTSQSMTTWNSILNRWNIYTSQTYTPMFWNHFGHSVSLSSDGIFLMVGAPGKPMLTNITGVPADAIFKSYNGSNDYYFKNQGSVKFYKRNDLKGTFDLLYEWFVSDSGKLPMVKLFCLQLI